MTPTQTQNEKGANVNAGQNQQEAGANYNTVSGNNSQLNGAITATPYYQNEVQAGTAATTGAYDNSARNLKQSMEAAGVQGNSGVAQGNATALGAQEDAALSTVKTNAYSDTENKQLQANSQDLEAAGQQDQTGLGYAGIANTDDQWRQGQKVANSTAAGGLAAQILSAGFGG